ncbi:hypothetical protein [Legionella yabuuchiae]|uniref:hypothetical protein n=1 Tax=Legionella yabuuchiae TaxID=376727 RepID=UPI00105690FC|nr:hypothetical protein [Legionella yabuuchiae]
MLRNSSKPEPKTQPRTIIGFTIKTETSSPMPSPSSPPSGRTNKFFDQKEAFKQALETGRVMFSSSSQSAEASKSSSNQVFESNTSDQASPRCTLDTIEDGDEDNEDDELIFPMDDVSKGPRA